MLKSLTGVSDDADLLIRRWNSWRKGKLLDALDTRSGMKRYSDIVAINSMVKSFADDAAFIASQASFKDLPQAMQDDVVNIRDQMLLGITEMSDHTDPEKKWASLDSGTKRDALQFVPIDNADVAKFKARLSGQLFDQVAPTPTPDPTPPNNPNAGGPKK